MYNFEIEAVLAAFPKTDKGSGEGVVPIAAVKNLETYLRCTTDDRDTVETKLEIFYALWASDGHASDCATHNEPAEPNGPCDCQPSPWIAVSDQKPTEVDASNEGKVWGGFPDYCGGFVVGRTSWDTVANNPTLYPFWMKAEDKPAPPSNPSTETL